jgi:hypothetical protein
MSSAAATVGNRSVSASTSQSVISTPVPPLSYNFTKPSGQTTQRRIGDDVWVEQNILNSIRTGDNPTVPRKANFTTLVNNNSFGNTNVFTDEFGLQAFANNYLLDNDTGYGWYQIAH